MGEINEEQKIFWENKKRAKRREPSHPVVAAFASPIINFVKKNLSPLQYKTLLDVGCGNGFFTYYFAKIYDTTGLDSSETMLEINLHSKLVRGNAENLPFEDGFFDIVFCGNLLHHLGSPEKAIREMKRVAKNYIVISEPNRNNPLNFIFGLMKKEERQSLRFDKKYINKICEQNGLRPIKSLTSGLIFPNKIPNFKILLKLLKIFDFNQPFGGSINIIYKKQ